MMPESRGVTLKHLSLTSDKVDEEHDEANALKYAISKCSFFFNLHSHSSHSFSFLVNMQSKALECTNAVSP